MNFRAALIAVSVLLSSAALSAQQPPSVTAQANTVYVSAEGHYEAAPDTALIQFNIAAQEETSRTAYDRASRAAEQIRQLLRNNGIDPKMAEVGVFSLAPVYDYRQPKRKLIAYRASSNVSLKLKDFSKVAPILEGLAGMDITEDQSLNYILDDMEAAKLRAVQDAFERARREAETVARAGGRALGELSYSSVDTYGPSAPVPMRTMALRAEGAMAKAPTEEFSTQRITVTARVSTVFAMK
jgi:uncharacterized protein YggE